jgi:hypothetical protein
MKATSRRLVFQLAVFTWLGISLAAGIAAGQGKGKAQPKRVAPPKFTKSDPFLKNAFDEGLKGERPTDLSKPIAAAGPAGGNSDGSSGAGGSTEKWSQLVSTTVLEDEIKAQKKNAENNVKSPSDFAGKGYSGARRDFCITGIMFAVIGEFDGDVRWKKDAASMRDAFSRAAGNCKTGSPQAFNEAKERKQDLTDLVGGQSVTGKPAEAKPDWTKVLDDRAPLMQRLDQSRDALIKAFTADKSAFKANSDVLAHEAQVFAVLAEVLTKEGLTNADDPEYVKLARSLQEGALMITKAVKDDDLAAAQKGATIINKSCDDCHGTYQ